MSFKQHDRQYDLVVFGATGYTGLMTAEHIAANLPTDLKWAVAGRSQEKLKNVVAECRKINADRLQPEIEICSLNDADLLALAKKTRVLITTVGPYAQYGEHAFKACAEAGTHYVDCTGEVVWTRAMIQKYEATAQKTGTIMIPQSGFDSAPSDLLTWSMAQTIRSQLSANIKDVVVDIHDLNTKPSGGTLATILSLVEKYSLKEIGAAAKPYALSPVPNAYHGPRPSLLTRLTGLHRVPRLGLLCTSVTAATDVPIVQRTWGLLQREASRRAEAYGPRFSYRELKTAPGVVGGVLTHYALAVGMALLMLVAPLRAFVRARVFQPGDGPSREAAHGEHIVLRGLAHPDTEDEKTAKVAMTKATYPASPYLLTAACLAQAACTILQDDVELEGGVYTPACLGQKYIDRLDTIGFKVETTLVDA